MNFDFEISANDCIADINQEEKTVNDNEETV